MNTKSEFDMLESVDETTFLKDHSFDDLVRERARLKSAAMARKKAGPRRHKASLSKPKSSTSVRRRDIPFMQRLLIAGEIEADVFRASLDYEYAYMIITGEAGLTASKYEPKRDRGWMPADDSTRRILLQHAYKEWRESVSVVQRRLVQGIILENRNIRFLEKEHGLRNGTAKMEVILGVQEFKRCIRLVLRRARRFANQKEMAEKSQKRTL